MHEGGWSIKLTPDRTLTITRPDGTVAWEGPSIDRTHARILLQGHGYMLADAGSGGTLLNGTRITEPMPLRPGP